MFELGVILPRPARVAKQGRCAEGLSVKTMLSADALEFGLPRFVRVFPSPRVFPLRIREPMVDNQRDDSAEKQYCSDDIKDDNASVQRTAQSLGFDKQHLTTGDHHQCGYDSAKSQPEQALPSQERLRDWLPFCLVSLWGFVGI